MSKRNGWNGNEASRDERRSAHYLKEYAALLKRLDDYVPCPLGFEGEKRGFCSAGYCTECTRDRTGLTTGDGR